MDKNAPAHSHFVSPPTPMDSSPTLGVELEMGVVDGHSGRSAAVNRYFEELTRIKRGQGEDAHLAYLDGRCVGVNTSAADCGLDNGFNLLETALQPVQGGQGSLDRLAAMLHGELRDSLAALRAEGLTVLNASQHPACRRDLDWYKRMRVPRPIYDELVAHRGWHHYEGMDAKAQNGVNIGVGVQRAAQALNVTLALSAASIALFANSPLESGRVTGMKENRLTLWPRMFRPGRFSGDFALQAYPARPFADLGDYFRWMFGPATVSRSLPASSHGHYKDTLAILLDGAPCLQHFLQSPGWRGRCMDTGDPVQLQPQTHHFVHSQIAVFLDARYRYRLARMPALDALLMAWNRRGGLEALFADHGVDGYIEVRAPGANFADRELLQDAGAAVARSVVVAPTALHLGVLRNLSDASRLVNDWGWNTLGCLRSVAMRDALADDMVYGLCRDVLELARDGLAPAEHRWLAYPDYVMACRRTGADRLLHTWGRGPGLASPVGTQDDAAAVGDRLVQVVERHAAICPSRFEPVRAAARPAAQQTRGPAVPDPSHGG